MHKKEFRPLTIPRLLWNKDTLTNTCGELIVQPLESGFGATLGNALRRTLLGAVEGSAVTSIIIAGINHEFTALPGVTEDAMQVVLNVKELIVKNSTGKPGNMRLQVTGPGAATAAQIVTDEHLEVINKDHIIAHVATQGTLDIQFFVETGREYSPAQWPIGQGLQADSRIYIDATFSPVRKVTYYVEKARVGEHVDYDKLTMHITTDGTETPNEVLHYAVSVLRTQLEHFLNVPEIPFNAISAKHTESIDGGKAAEPVEKTIRGISAEFLLKPIDVLEFSVRAHNCLINAGIKRIIDLVNLSEDDVLKIKNFGKKSYDEVKESMKNFSLSLDMHINEADVLKLLGQE